MQTTSMQIPILSGIFTDENSEFRTAYPRNIIPVVKNTGISQGYLRPGDGIVELGEGPGVDRGGINWRDECYRVMGTKLVKIFSTGGHTVIGDVGGVGQVNLDYSFDHLAINSGNFLFLYDGTTLTQVIDSDLGVVLDVIWVDGFFMTTDGVSLVVTDIDDPFSINPLKFASSEADPDPIKGVLKIRNEPHAFNRYTIEVFQNIAGSGFPFERVEGAQIEKGSVGTNSACVFMERIAFVGSGRNEAPSIYLGSNGQTLRIATREIDLTLLEYTEEELSESVCEARVDKGHQHLWVRLPDRTLVYDGMASLQLKEPVWHTLTTSILGNGKLKAQNLVWCYDKWLVGDPFTNRHGTLTTDVSTHFGETIGWDFGTIIIYNEGRGAIFHELELVCLTGRTELSVDPTIWTQYSLDGETWSQERARTAGKRGQRNKRISWLRQGHMRHWRIQRFRGTSDSRLTMARLEASIEALNE